MRHGTRVDCVDVRLPILIRLPLCRLQRTDRAVSLERRLGPSVSGEMPFLGWTHLQVLRASEMQRAGCSNRNNLNTRRVSGEMTIHRLSPSRNKDVLRRTLAAKQRHQRKWLETRSWGRPRSHLSHFFLAVRVAADDQGPETICDWTL